MGLQMDTTGPVPAGAVASSKLSLSRRYMAVSALVMLAAALVTGAWMGRQIERSVIQRTANLTSLYVDSFVGHYLGNLSGDEALPPGDVAALDDLLADSPLGDQIVSFKLWSPDGRILYSPDSDLIGLHFEPDEEFQESLSGAVTSAISTLDDDENEFERRQWTSLIETYAPLSTSDGRVIGVTEFYQRPDELLADISEARQRTWLVVGGIFLGAYLLLAGIVSRASRVITNQQSELRAQVQQNEALHGRVQRAATRTVGLNERFLRRIAADLHDGPGQELAVAMLRVDPLIDSLHDPETFSGQQERVHADLDIVKRALELSLQEVRTIASGLRSPHIEELSLIDTVRQAVREHERKSELPVELEFGDVPDLFSESAKITLYRIIQEALNNGLRHASGQGQRVWVGCEAEHVVVEISDSGPGFDFAHSSSGSDRLGVAGMRERVEILGGTFVLEARPGGGTVVMARLPLLLPEEVS